MRKIRRGRRAGQTATRSAIFSAARHSFGARGYRATSMRAIAAEAGVDAALVHHFFGSKADLYAAVTAPAERATGALLDAASSARPGAEIVRAFVRTWDGEEASQSPLGALLRSAGSDGDAEQRLANLIATSFTATALAASDRGSPMPKLRAHLVAAQLCGLAWLRYVQHLEPVASASADLLARIYGPALDELLAPRRDGAKPTIHQTMKSAG